MVLSSPEVPTEDELQKKLWFSLNVVDASAKVGKYPCRATYLCGK